MREVKKYTTYKEQIDKLESRGCLIDNYAECEDVLRNVGYYRLSAYFLPFKGEDGKYTEGLSFDRIYGIYEFDSHLRSILFSAIEEIEISFRARLSYFHSGKYGPLGYLDPSTFNSKHNVQKFQANIQREIESNKNALFVKHHIEEYGGQFPLWVISELFTFGMLSYFYNDLSISDKKLFAGHDYKNMVSWLRCCTDLRNICAHNGRLYYRAFTAMPSGVNIEETSKRKLWGAILTVKQLYPSTDKWNSDFLPSIERLFKKYESSINLCHLAFPNNWIEQLRK